MINLINNLDLIVYEVLEYEYDEDYETTECRESDYVLVNSYDTSLDDVIKSVVNNPHDCLIQVYMARTATFVVGVGKNNKIDYLETDEVDCATGYSGSPILEVYYDKEGNIFNPIE